jgi:hypothetical protein
MVNFIKKKSLQNKGIIKSHTRKPCNNNDNENDLKHNSENEFVHNVFQQSNSQV